MMVLSNFIHRVFFVKLLALFKFSWLAAASILVEPFSGIVFVPHSNGIALNLVMFCKFIIPAPIKLVRN